MEWLPIDSAPIYDRESPIELLVWGPHLDEPIVRSADGEWWRSSEYKKIKHRLTHWMPLPKPPTI